MEPTTREKELQRTAQLLVYVCEKTGTKPPAYARKQAGNIYAADERSVPRLCSLLKKMSPKELDRIVYNARSKDARDLANWWEEHQAADAKREQEEAAEQERVRVRDGALAKLSDEERAALNV